MKTRTVAMMALALAAVLALLVNVALAQGIQPAKSAPAGAKAIKAFSKQHAGCEGKMEWTVQAAPEDWVDVGVDWIAKDNATAKDNVEHLTVAISVDGQQLGDLSDYRHGPDPASLECPGMVYDGGAISWKVYVPPLAAGDHKVTWKIAFHSDVNDGWSVTPQGTVVDFTSTVHVGPTTLPVAGGVVHPAWAWLAAGGLALLAGLGLRKKTLT